MILIIIVIVSLCILCDSDCKFLSENKSFSIRVVPAMPFHLFLLYIIISYIESASVCGPTRHPGAGAGLIG